MSHWKHFLTALVIAGASGAAIASDTTAYETTYGSDYAPAASESAQGETSSERAQGQGTQSSSSEGEAS